MKALQLVFACSHSFGYLSIPFLYNLNITRGQDYLWEYGFCFCVQVILERFELFKL